MTAKFYDYFSGNDYDNRVVFKDSQREYTVLEVKQILEKKLDAGEKFKDIIDFLTNVIRDKNYITKIYTSGTSANNPKCVQKSMKNFLDESRDVWNELGLDRGLEFISTTTINHLFGLCFQLIIPLDNGCIINLDRISYPEDLKIKNAVLITTPSFLEALRKYDACPEVKPKVIISAGAPLSRETFDYAIKISERVIDLYGSTETGSIAYRERPDGEKLKLFKGIKILETKENGTLIKTNYSYESSQKLSDRIKLLNEEEIELLGRCDRVLKVQEKRIRADEIEIEIRKQSFVEACFCLDTGGKIGALCVLSKEGLDFLIKEGKLEIVKQLKLALNNKFEVIPQKWKFFDKIPVNERGKVDIEKIKAIFDINLSLPLVLSRNIAEDKAVFELCFLRSSNFFQGHFEGLPILAGVVQLFYADFFIKEAFNIECRQGQIRRIKFSNIIRPEKKLKLILNHAGNGISFKFEDDNLTYSSGVFPIKNYL